MERPTERQVLDWLIALGQLVASNQPLAEVRERLMAYLPLLVERYDSRDFNQVSREFVARQCKFFPSYGELCDALDKWPKPAAKPLKPQRQESGIPEGRQPPDEAEIAAVHALVQEAIRGMKAARIPQSRPFSAPPKPLPDVTLKGEALAKSRAARGCNVPVPEPVPEHEEALF
jgi:hypothetical protein